MKYIFIIILFSIFVFPAYAALDVGNLPNRDPLQPIPEGISPNYKGNINFEAEEVQGFAPQYGEENFGDQSEEINNDGSVSNVSEKNQTSNWPWAVAIVLFIGGVAGFIYAQVKKRK